MRRSGFLKALAGLGAVAVAPKVLKEEEGFVVTSEDGRTAWDSEGNQVWSVQDDFWTSQYMDKPQGWEMLSTTTSGAYITYASGTIKPVR